MKNKTTVAVIVFLLAMGATVARAQDKVSENSKFSIMALTGYRSSGEFQIASEDVAYSTLLMKGGLAYGLTVGYRLSEILSVEAMWSRSGSSLEGIFPVAAALPNVKLFSLSEDQFHANVLLSAGYSIGKVDPYFLLGLGLTSINPSGDVPGASRFSWSLGTGFNAMISKKIGVRGQVKLAPTYISNIDTILNEWVGGVQTVSLRNTMVQWEFTVGLFFRL
jgi:hypothetical protein